MRESIGGTWLFGIVVVFIVLFTSFLAISVNYSKAFRVKNFIVDAIEKYEGHGNDTQQIIENYNKQIGYGVGNSCSGRGSGFGKIIRSNGTETSRYCVECHESFASEKNGNRMPKTYYTVTVFFKLDLPIIGNLFVFPVTGQTKTIVRECYN